MIPSKIAILIAPVIAGISNVEHKTELAKETFISELTTKIELQVANKSLSKPKLYQLWVDSQLEKGWSLDVEYDEELKSDYRLMPYAENNPVDQDIFSITLSLASSLEPLMDLSDSLALASEVENLRKVTAEQKDELASLLDKYNELRTKKDTPVDVVLRRSGKTIKYIGTEDVFKDRLYDSGAVFQRGEVLTVPVDVANKLLRHPEFVEERLGSKARVEDLDKFEERDAKKREEAREEEAANNGLRDTLLTFDKKGLVSFAQDHFNTELSMKSNKAELYESVLKLIDMHGSPL